MLLLKFMLFNRFTLDKSNIILYILAAFVLASSIYFYLTGRTDPVTETINKGNELSCLFVVHDQGKPVLSAMYVYNAATKRGAIFDIPGNTGFTIQSLNRVDRIDAVFKPEKPAEYAKITAQLLGLERPPFYFVLSLNDLSALIDLEEGVEIFVAKPILRETRGEVISLPSGSSNLDGAKAREFLLASEEYESMNQWVERRQKFLQAFLQRLSQKSSLTANAYADNFIRSLLTTNMQGAALSAFWRELAQLDPDNLMLQKITGSVRIVDGKHLIFPHYEGRLAKETMRQALEALKSVESAAAKIWPRKLEIQNGTTRNGLASRTAQIFESMGYQVAGISNSDTFDVNYTVVLDLKGNMEAAKRVAEIIRCARVYSMDTEEDENDNTVDVRIILGKDFDGRYTQQIIDSD